MKGSRSGYQFSFAAFYQSDKQEGGTTHCNDGEFEIVKHAQLVALLPKTTNQGL